MFQQLSELLLQVFGFSEAANEEKNLCFVLAVWYSREPNS